jgi:hypothetical protein
VEVAAIVQGETGVEIVSLDMKVRWWVFIRVYVDRQTAGSPDELSRLNNGSIDFYPTCVKKISEE